VDTLFVSCPSTGRNGREPLGVGNRNSLEPARRIRNSSTVVMHANQLRVPIETVRHLVDWQFPEWIDLPIEPVKSHGTVNAIFRIGERLAARFPLQPGDPRTMRRQLEAEARAARELLRHSPVPTPQPIAIGDSGAGYPLPWSVQTWLPGTVAADADPGESVEFAHDLATFIQAVRAIDARGRVFDGPGRGGDLRSHDVWVDTCLQRSGHLLDVARLRDMWAALRTTPRTVPDDVMTHGDLVPGNVLVSHGRLAGVLDVGGLGPADSALDLVCAWHLLETTPRQVLHDDLDCDDTEWARGMAWAFEQALGAVWYYERSNSTMSRMGRRTLDRIVTDESSG
jgi:aminoglycoside phosphotransferase (APT) family kinase protein